VISLAALAGWLAAGAAALVSEEKAVLAKVALIASRAAVKIAVRSII